ncbi:GatB/YqeY domain-containing protein [Petroclostridium sp. X23]|uniref:GatB/YqeY domain-containing protein n=1 Tax=Petroclostridium sp. X23 TaxID=3045146 RepID=UPI0024AD13EF|nr:GatB/YqeY domain-containing protein [Petroclostridium sp. X23]WHH59672.1 GatB/YqeY domain-containing protein [Petroclostridium sp. X23]
MSLKDRLLEDMKSAMKEKDLIKKNTVQMTRAAILQVEKDNKVTLDDEGVIEILAKEVKKRKDVLPEYEKSGRQDLIDDLNREVEVLMGYLPEQLSEEELEQMIKTVIEEVGASAMKDMGKVMAAIMPKTKGRADGKMINLIAKKYLT